ncbi:hypothetical protein [Aneurinibacillus aneurinilyticus]|jgi:uncharacterized membrane-anchored protein YhcB (DUF1043 family)|uniref:hypothetical protein n=1 Tax=Aneurinibacillus aneurinilyticus TaxID=1391 RepID=UPI0023F6FC8C|nr:hypothetical protein [Aneurinibacillus aneurinilyticus]MCI1694842.1 hypothetical protein [Aneurinibacillus aneurinilyticus]MED0672054.1 hypothetical protein [Aneurinibacillus aneurinilyticus]
MEIYLWTAMFYIVVFIGIISIVGMVVNRSAQGTHERIDQLQQQVRKLEEELKKKS